MIVDMLIYLMGVFTGTSESVEMPMRPNIMERRHDDRDTGDSFDDHFNMEGVPDDGWSDNCPFACGLDDAILQKDEPIREL